MPRHAHLTKDGYGVELPGGRLATACRTFMNSYAITVRSYFDGSGKEADTGCKLLTLAGLAAPLSAWDWLESKWAGVCWKHNVCGSHMKEAMHLHGDFDKARGWDKDRLEIFTCDLENVFLGFGDLPETFFSVATINLEAHRHVSQHKPTITVDGVERAFPSASELCAFSCLNFLHWRRDSGNFELFFDRGEPFYNLLYQPWNDKKTLMDVRLKRVTQMMVGSQDYNLPLQGSDFFAWHVNRHWTRRDTLVTDRLASLVGGSSIFWDIQHLVDDEKIASTLTGTWGGV